MDHAAAGKKALEAKDYQQAITHYTAALKQSPTSPDYLIQRSTAYQRNGQYDLALADGDQAVLAAQKRAKKESIIEAQFRRGCSLYGLERYGDAKFLFDVVMKMNEKHKTCPTFLFKTKGSLQKLEEGDERARVTVTETPDGELKGGDGPVSPEPKQETNGTSTNGGTGAISAPTTTVQQTPKDKIRHEWYQNTENVYFTLLAKGVPKDKAQVDIQERSISISFPLASGSDYVLTLEPLFAPVQPGKCIIRVMATKLEIILVKAQAGQKWSSLESNEPIPETTAADENGIDADAVKRAVFTSETAPKGPAYPTSSKSGPKDWDKIVSDSKTKKKEDGTESIEDDEDYEGGDPANHFLKKLFKGADPDTQRAMMKSYTESNGTALSTDWSEVSKGKVETVPPDGMGAKGWNK